MITALSVPDNLQPDEVVDIVIRHAEVQYGLGEDGMLSIGLHGVDHQVLIPTRDDDGKPMPYQVTVTRAKACTGCGRVIPLSESVAGFTTCEHCPKLTNWPPQPGDLWRDKFDDLWLFIASVGRVPLTARSAKGAWTDHPLSLAGHYGPMTLVHREPSGGAL